MRETHLTEDKIRTLSSLSKPIFARLDCEENHHSSIRISQKGSFALLCPMEKTAGQLPMPGSRQLNLKKLFKLGIYSLLTTCSKEEFSKALPTFSSAEQGDLYHLFTQVITALHENIEDEFESLCLETQLGTILDTVEQLVEEQSMDPLCSAKSNIGDVGRDLLTAKKNEIQYLIGMLEKAEEQKHLIEARVDLLKKEMQDFSGTTDTVEKLRSEILNYGT